MTGIPAQYVAPEEWDKSDGADYPAGAFTIVELKGGGREMLFNCPSGDGSECAIALRPTTERPSWDFSGTLEKPTLNPSVHRQFFRRDGSSLKTIWHGWLRDGVWQSC